jgi:hypothetical protein
MASKLFETMRLGIEYYAEIEDWVVKSIVGVRSDDRP